MAKRNKCAVKNRRKISNRYHKRSDDSSDSETMSGDIKEIFDQMDVIYGELEVNSNESFSYQNSRISQLDASLDHVYEQIGKWLVGYCGTLVQREQVGFIDVDCLENLLDKLLGISYQLDGWAEVVEEIVNNNKIRAGNKHNTDTSTHDLSELERRQGHVQNLQNYLTRIKERHSENLLTSDRRPYSQLTPQDKETLAFRYSRFMSASFPLTSVERLHEIIGKVTIDKIPLILQSC